MNSTTLAVAFVAGLISFLSPCVLPIIPGFLSYLAGASMTEAKNQRLSVFMNSVFFVLGFSLVFALLGVLLNTVLGNVAGAAQTWLARVGGTIIILFGLYLLGIIHPKFLQQEHKLQVHQFRSRYVTSLLFGAAFAAGWTPCVGAVLGGILALAVSQPGSAFSLLLFYAIGLGMPFLVVGLFVAQASAFIHRYGKVLVVINKAFGVILIIVGIFAFTQNLSKLASFEFLNQYLLSK